jgi:hypothetical protein
MSAHEHKLPSPETVLVRFVPSNRCGCNCPIHCVAAPETMQTVPHRPSLTDRTSPLRRRWTRFSRFGAPGGMVRNGADRPATGSSIMTRGEMMS